jgi:YggT family protein
MATFLTLFNAVANLIWWIIIIQFVMSWLINFNVINRHQPMVGQIWYTLNRITEPVYRPIRRMLPDMGGIDFSPVIVLFALYALQVVVHNNLAPMANGG